MARDWFWIDLHELAIRVRTRDEEQHYRLTREGHYQRFPGVLLLQIGPDGRIMRRYPLFRGVDTSIRFTRYVEKGDKRRRDCKENPQENGTAETTKLTFFMDSPKPRCSEERAGENEPHLSERV